MLYNSLCVCLLVLCVIGCSTDSTDDESIFPVPPIISEEEQEVTPPGIPVEIVPPPVPQPIVKDLTAPKLLESTVDSGRVDPKTDVISLRFNEDIIEIDIKLVDSSDVSLRWIPSIDLITGRRIFLTRIDGRGFGSDRKYYIKGFVEDKDGNKTSIDIEFRAVEENRDRTAPSILTHSINHEQRNVSINIDQFVFTFNEDIDEAEVSLIRGEDWKTGTDMRWTRFIDKKKVVLLKTTGKSLSLRNGETYTVVLSARDASGNWTPGNNRVWIFKFTTQK